MSAVISQHTGGIFRKGSIHSAAELGDVERIEQLVREGVVKGYPEHVTLQSREDLMGMLPLHAAAEKGQVAVVKFLLDRGVDVDCGDSTMVTPLHLAAINGHTDVLRLLLSHGAHATRQDVEGDVPLHWAATKGNLEVLDILLNAGCPLDGPNKQGWTALHRAALNGRTTAARLLLRRGASIHALTSDGNTPLHLACRANHISTIELLLEMGARVQFLNYANKLPADLAVNGAARDMLQAANDTRGVAGGSRPGSVAGAPQGGPGSPKRESKAGAGARTSFAPGVVTDVSVTIPAASKRRPGAVRLDADGFPVDINSPAGHGAPPETPTDPHLGDGLGGAFGTQLYAVPSSTRIGLPSKAANALGEEPQYLIDPLVSEYSRMSLMSQQSGGRSEVGPWGGDERGDSRMRSPSKKGGQLVPPPLPSRGPSQNKKFLDRYNLGKNGLFAP